MKATWKANPVGSVAVVLGTMAFLFQVLAGWGLRAQARQVRSDADALARRWHDLTASPLAPTSTNLDALRADRHRREMEVRSLKAALIESRDAPDLPEPQWSAAELYFGIIGYIEDMRGAAEAAGIELRADECFGFRQIVEANAMVLEEDERAPKGRRSLAMIAAQRRDLELLLEQLIQARPFSLESVQRESPEGSATRAAGRPSDIFHIHPRLTAAIPGVVETSAYRLVFSGRTETLRNFLAGVDALDRAFAVRGVEVRAASADGRSFRLGTAGSPLPVRDARIISPFALRATDAEKAAGEDVGPVPIIDANLSRFVVVVEACSLLDEEQRVAMR